MPNLRDIVKKSGKIVARHLAFKDIREWARLNEQLCSLNRILYEQITGFKLDRLNKSCFNSIQSNAPHYATGIYRLAGLAAGIYGVYEIAQGHLYGATVFLPLSLSFSIASSREQGVTNLRGILEQHRLNPRISETGYCSENPRLTTAYNPRQQSLKIRINSD